MTNVKKILFLAFPLVIVLGGLVLFFDGTNTAVAATELTARIEKKTAVSPTPISTQTVTPAADPPACTTPTRILPAGDSITQGQYSSTDAGYRLPLYLSLRNAGYDVQFVGQLMNGPTPGFDNNHEGYGGKKTQFFVVSLANWVEDQSADIVLYHIGTNDVPNGIDDAIINTNTILDQIDAKSTDVTVVVAQIINRTCNGPNCAVEQAATSTYNDNLQILVDDRVAVGDDLVIVDMEHDAQLSYFVEPAGDFANFLHPNDTGYEKMAAVWFDALASTLPTTCNTPPLIVQDAITTATVNNRYTHQLTASGYGTLNYSLTSAPDGMTIDPATGFISWIPSIAQIGSNSVIVEVTNTAGSDSYSFSIDVTNAGIAVIQKPYEVTLTSGSSLQYSVTITNTGATDLDPVIVDFPQTPSCNDSILLGAGVNTTITCDLTNITADLTHEVLVTGTNSVPEQFTASDVGTINIINPQLEIVKTTTTPTVLKGDPVTFNVSITNTGDVDLTNVFVVDADVADCDRPALGTLTQTQNISYSCSLVSATTDLVSSKITVTGTHQLGQISGTDTIDVDVIAPAIALGVDPHDQHILSGDNAGFNITITNTGDVALDNVTLSHPQVSCVLSDFGTIAASATKTTTCSATNVTADFYNNMSVTGDHPLGQVTDDVYAIVDVFSNDIAIAKTAVSTALAGSTVNFTLTVTNTSGTDLSNVIIHDPLVGFTKTVSSLADGAVHNEVVSVNNAQADISNTAFVTVTLPNMATTSDSDLAVVSIIDPGIDIVVTPSSQEIEVNASALLTITVFNTGDIELTNVSVSMAGAANCTRNLGTIADQSSKQFTCTVTGIKSDVTKTAVATGHHPIGTVQAQDTAVITLNQFFIYLPMIIK